ncbi:hypothetical protein ABZ490_44075 [Streptomyces sp. NPDC005811]|uniref:hypothetical protein n=1 Tax=Streptomyces sp. NPDC005811 TaxID=3154565 RepID=UPI0033FF3F9A
MTPQPLVDAGLVEAADRALARALDGPVLVSAERFCASMRTLYTGPAPPPAVAACCYPGWSDAAPDPVLAAETRTRARGPGQRHAWMQAVDAEASALLRTLAARPVIAAWYATDRLRRWAGPGGTVAAIDGRLRAAVEDKAAFDALLRAAGVPERTRITCVRVNARLPDLAELRAQVGAARLVVQSGADSGGRGTVFVDSDADLARAASMDGPYKVAAFVEGWSSNVTVLTVPDGQGRVSVYMDRPSHKAAGIPEAGIGLGQRG